MSSITIRYENREFQYDTAEHKNLLTILREHGIPVNAPCGGRGTCGKCRVTVNRGEKQEKVRACGFVPEEGCEVLLPAAEGGAIRSDYRGNAPAADFTKKADGKSYGAAADIGTTTVAVELFELMSGTSLGKLADWNTQRAFGADVITRAQYTLEQPDGLDMLKDTVQSQIMGMLCLLCTQNGVSLSEIEKITVSGNTIMQHLLLGLDPAAIVKAPFQPEEFFTGEKAWHFAGLPAEILPSPCVAGYVGGDITAGLLASGLNEKDGQYLFLDIGTNGELALGGRKGFLTCAAACGPAFEGAEITCGMASLPGAITHVKIGKEDLEFEVLENAPVRGICGSGLIDLLAILLEYGIVNGAGRLLSPEDVEDSDEFDSIPEKMLARLEEDPDGNGIFYLSEDHSVFLNAADVRKLQLAKGAVSAGIETLLRRARISAEDLSGVVIAGGFGGSLNLTNAAKIGMLPANLEEKTECIGNSALAGAAMVLKNPALRQELLEITEKCSYLELSGDPEFTELFVEHMMFETGEDD